MKPIIGLLLVSVLVGHSYGGLPPMNYTNGDGMGCASYLQAIRLDSCQQKGFANQLFKRIDRGMNGCRFDLCTPSVQIHLGRVPYYAEIACLD